jgi:hypothetical protein
MKSKDTAAKLHEVLSSIAKRQPTRNGRSSFASVVKMGYEDIRELRAKGYSFRFIMEELIEAGFFPPDTDSKYLCQAFTREKKNRETKMPEKSNLRIRAAVNSN